MENVNQEHVRRHENRNDRNRSSLEKEANSKVNQTGQIQDRKNLDIQSKYNDRTQNHTEDNQTKNWDKLNQHDQQRDDNTIADENNPAPSKRSNEESERGDNRHNL